MKGGFAPNCDAELVLKMYTCKKRVSKILMLSKSNMFFTNAKKGALTEDFKVTIREQLGVPVTTEFGRRIGSESTLGSVYEMKNYKVLKVVIDTSSFKGDFENEVRVGHIPGIEKVGTRIYQSAYLRVGESRIGVYIMDNLVSNTKNTAMTLEEYWSKNKTPEAAKMYAKLLYTFYKITRGWHGDLHANNIQVILGPGMKLKRMRVIDYGSHTEFKTNISKMKTLDAVLNAVNRNFEAMPNRGQQQFWKEGPHKLPGGNRRQWVISNARVVRSQPIYALAKQLVATNDKVQTNKVTPGGRPIYKGPRGGTFVLRVNKNGTIKKVYKKTKRT